MSDWDWWNRFVAWLSEWLNALLHALDLATAINNLALWLVSWLPAPNSDIVSVVDLVVTAVRSVAPAIAMLDYFVDARFFVLLLTLRLLTETVLFFVRCWRFIRSFIT